MVSGAFVLRLAFLDLSMGNKYSVEVFVNRPSIGTFNASLGKLDNFTTLCVKEAADRIVRCQATWQSN